MALTDWQNGTLIHVQRLSEKLPTSFWRQIPTKIPVTVAEINLRNISLTAQICLHICTYEKTHEVKHAHASNHFIAFHKQGIYQCLKVCYYSNKAYTISDKQSLHKQTIQLATPWPQITSTQSTRVISSYI